MMLNLLIGMIGNTYNQYAESSKALLLLEKYNITCSLERYLSGKEKNRERKKFAIELEENTDNDNDSDGSKSKNWAFEHVFFDKEWKNRVSDEDEEGGAVTSKAGLSERVVLLIICPQKDFHSGGSLAVPGADDNSDQIAEMIMNDKNIGRIDEIYVALDSHYRTHIAHAICWKHVEDECPFEKDGLIKWKYPYDKTAPAKYDLCFTALGLFLPVLVALYEGHTEQVEKTYQWKYYSHEVSNDINSDGVNTIALNFFLEEIGVSEPKPKDTENEIQLEQHRMQKYEFLPFKKVITFDRSDLSDIDKKLKTKDDKELQAFLQALHVPDTKTAKTEYWYHPKSFAEILNSDLNQTVTSKSDASKRPLFEVIKNDNFDQDWADYYTHSLERKGNYKLTIWPEHCIIGSSGHSVVDKLNNSLQHWARKNKKAIQYIEKGQNCKTELYSILEAEVEDPADVTTASDADLFAQLKIADKILICGQASSHCVKSTVEDLEKYWPGEDRSKMIILKDGCSPVAGYEKVAEGFFEKMKEKGLTITTCAEVSSLINADIKTEQQAKVMNKTVVMNKMKRLEAQLEGRQDKVMAEIIALLLKQVSPSQTL